MNDLTVIYYTANKAPDFFAENIRRNLQTAIGSLPLISISKKPLKFGLNICEEEKESSIINAYKAVLLGAKTAKTKYVALAEDDTLYPDEHFKSFLPPPDTFAYNTLKWNILTWSRPPFFYYYPRKILANMIAPRDLLIEIIEERFNKYPDLSKLPLKWMGEPGRNDHERNLGVIQRKSIEFQTYNPLVVFTHEDSFGHIPQTRRRKGAGKVRALELPYWGRAEKVMGLYEKR